MTPTTMISTWTDVRQALDGAGRILLVTHIQPDGDAIGSLLGLGGALRARGLTVDLAVDDGVPDFARWLPGADTVLGALSEGSWDVLVTLDASDEGRTGLCGAYGMAHSRRLVNIDHHPTNTRFGDVQLIVPEAVSTTEIIQDWLALDGQALTPAIAAPLLVGLVTDTIGFRTSNVTTRTLALAQALMAAGASLPETVARTLNSKPYKAIALWQRSLGSVSLEHGLIVGSVTRADWQSAGYGETNDGGLVSYLITTDEARVAAVFKERSDGSVEISLRSKPGYDVGQVALSLGGGGHTQAAGAVLPGPLAEAQARVLPLLRGLLT
jgi:phosphoesterase RecJ-like protein